MSYRVGILADDLTGAATMAGEFARYGAPATITDLGEAPPPEDAGVWALNLACRDLDEAENDRLAREGLQQLKRWDPHHVLVKIDSRLRGFPGAFLAPSLADQGGLLVLQPHGTNLQERALSLVGAPGMRLDDPLAASHRSWESLLADRKIVVVQTGLPEPGEHIVRSAAQAGCRLWIGSYGLADTLAGHLALQSARPILVVAGSFNEITFEQIRVLAERGITHVPLDFTNGLNGFLHQYDSYREHLETALSRTSMAVLSTARAQSEVEKSLASAEREGHSRPEAVSSTARHVGQLVADAIPVNLAGLVLTGGGTAHAVLRALRCRDLRPTGIEPIAGAPLSEVRCERYDRLSIVTKPGGLGGPPDLLRSLQFAASHSLFRG